MLKYNDFLLEAQLVKIEQDYINESFDSINDSITKFLDKEFTVDTGKFEEVVLNLLNRFKNKLKIIVIIVGLLTGGYMTGVQVKNLLGKAGFSKEQQDKIVTETSNKIHNDPLKIKNKAAKVVKTSKNEIRKFLKALAQRESSSDPNIVNSLGYIGKYQMGQMALQDLELDDKINAHKFKKNPNIFPEKAQDKAMVKLLKLNKQYLGDYINEFDGKIINGVKITKSGLLAGSHLVGAGAVKEFLDSNGQFVPKDGNGIPVTDYIKKFGGYQLTF
jgi:hypothetical protein